MTSLLRPLPAELRPNLVDHETVLIAVEANRTAILAWAYGNGFSHGETDESILEGVTCAMSQAQGEPERAARLMQLGFRWQVDANIIWHLTAVQKNMLPALEQRIRRWVVASGTRFPGKEGDLIVWADGSYNRNSRIVKVLRTHAQAIIENDSGVKTTINAEQVLANRTNGKEIQRAFPMHDPNPAPEYTY